MDRAWLTKSSINLPATSKYITKWHRNKYIVSQSNTVYSVCTIFIGKTYFQYITPRMNGISGMTLINWCSIEFIWTSRGQMYRINTPLFIPGIIHYPLMIKRSHVDKIYMSTNLISRERRLIPHNQGWYIVIHNSNWYIIYHKTLGVFQALWLVVLVAFGVMN